MCIRDSVRAAARDDERRCTPARRHVPRLLAGPADPRAAAAPGGRELAADRPLHDAEHRLVILDQRDVDGELAVALDELARAVERIDEPVARPALARRPGDARR